MSREMWLAIGLLSAGVLPPGEAVGQIPDGWEIIEITNDPSFYDGRPDINDKGQIVFHRWPYPDQTQIEIMLYDRGELIQLTDDDVKDVFPKLNNKGEIVWMRDVDGDGKDDIVKWHDGDLCVVSAFAFHEGGPDINDAGWVVWSGYINHDGVTDQLFLFDGTETFQLTDNGLSNQMPRINELGVLSLPVTTSSNRRGHPRSSYTTFRPSSN